MRNYIMAVLVLVGVGCSREDEPETLSGNVLTLSTTISREGDAPTRALTELGVKTFSDGDKIAVVYEKTDGNYSKAVATLGEEDIFDGGKSARITVSLNDPKADGHVTYVYPAAMVWDNGNENIEGLYGEQDGTLGKIAASFDYAKFDGTLSGTELPLGTLANQLAICKFTILDGDSHDITGYVTRLTIKNGSDVYHVNTSSLSSIWVAMKPISSGNIDIYAARGWALHRKTVTGNPALPANTLTPVTVTAPQVEGALSGLFSINANHDLVYFSQGNLRAEWNWDEDISANSWDHFNFAPYQHIFTMNYSGNVSVGNPTPGDVIDLFGWSTTAGPNYFGINNSEDDSVYSNGFYDWGIANIRNGGGRNKWRTPSESELAYILFQRPSGSTIRFDGMSVLDSRYMRVYFPPDSESKIHVAGLVLFPDHFILPALENTTVSWNDINEDNSEGVLLDWDDWGRMENAGAVFLPAAGFRIGTEVNLFSLDYPDGCYWTCNQGEVGYEAVGARCFEFGKTYHDEDKDDSYLYVGFYTSHRYAGSSVRLIGPAKF